MEAGILKVSAWYDAVCELVISAVTFKKIVVLGYCDGKWWDKCIACNCIHRQQNTCIETSQSLLINAYIATHTAAAAAAAAATTTTTGPLTIL